MDKRLILLPFAMVSVFAVGFAGGGDDITPTSYRGGYYASAGSYRGGAVEQDVDLETLGDDIIAGEYWTPDVDFSSGTKYYFDPTLDPTSDARGDGSIDDPFYGLGYEAAADTVIERRDTDGDPTVANAANSPVVGPDDVCVLLRGNHGNLWFYKYYFPDYMGIVAMSGQRVLFDNIWLRASSYFYFEGLEANPENTRNNGTWAAGFQHTLGVYDDYDDAPFFVRCFRDSNNNGTPNHNVFNRIKVGISSEDLPASWEHSYWNSHAVGGFDIDRNHQIHIQNCYGVGMSHGFNVFNYNLATSQEVQVINNTFRYLNADGWYSARTQGNQIAGNTFTDFYISNDDHVGAIEIYDRVARHLVEGNKIVVTRVPGRNPVMEGYTNDGGTEGVGVTGIYMIGDNTNSIIRNNVIHDNAYSALAIRTTYGSSYNVLVANNTVTCDSLHSFNTGGDTGLIRSDIYAAGDTLGVTFINNICSEVRIDAADTWSIESNNSEYALDFTGAGFVSWTPEDDPLSQDVDLALGSVNIDAGTRIRAPANDISGDCRYKGTLPDIGAYEYDDGAGCPADDNIIGDSWDITNTSCWNPDLSKLSYTFGQIGLFDNNAVLVEYLGTQWASFTQLPYLVFTGDTVVLSVYIKNDDTSDTQLLKPSLYDNDDSTDHNMRFKFNASDVPIYYDESGIDDYGIEDFGGGWYRLWIMVDLKTRGLTGNEFRIRFNPCEAVTTLGEGFFHNGMQVEYDVIYPGNYTKTDCP